MLYELNRKHVNKQRSSQATPKCSQQWYKDKTTLEGTFQVTPELLVWYSSV